MKKIEIEIPEGKKAEWVDGVLTLVDDKPQGITDRIKTFEDACNMLGDEHPFVTQFRLTNGAFKGDFMTEDFIAYLKLRVICAALNEGWEPTFGADECRYYPWYYIYTKEEYEELYEEDKKACRVVGRSGGSSYAGGGLVYVYSSHAKMYSNSHFGSRLAFKTRELCEYCGNQFIDIWEEFLFG